MAKVEVITGGLQDANFSTCFKSGETLSPPCGPQSDLIYSKFQNGAIRLTGRDKNRFADG
jgi:hypothetical protein